MSNVATSPPGTKGNPVVMGTLACPKCACPSMRVVMCSMSGGVGIDHLDFYCPVCNTFVNHLDCTPHENIVIDKD